MSLSDSSDYSSSESEVEYEPIIIEDAEGKKMSIKEESNPLAPVIVVNTNPTSSDKSGKPKKSKVFASKDTMLSLIESVNSVQDGKIQAKLDRDASYLQRLTNIEKATQERKSMKNERLNKIKDNLRKGGVRVKGENKKTVRDIHAKETAERGQMNRGSGGRSTSKPSGRSTSKPSGRSTGKPSGRSTGKSSGRSTAKPSGRSTGKPSVRPTSNSSSRPTNKPSGRPSSNKPSGRSTNKPSGKMNSKPSSKASNGKPQKKVKFAV